MTDGLVFYTNPMSRGRVVRWMLEEVGQPYRTEILDFGTTMKGPDYLAINPMGKVPAIVHDGTVVTETGAICAYLADAFPQAKLAPTFGSHERGPYYRWMFFGAGPLETAATNQALGFVVPEDRRGMSGYGGELAGVLDVLEKTLARADYLAGGAFSAADLFVGAQLGWLMQFGIVDKRPAFVSYVKRISDRPAAVRAREIDDALLPAKG
jgi:glutathione S-transferase